MEPMVVLAFAAIALTLVAVPGPDWAYVLASGIRDRAVAAPIAGILAGYAMITVVVAAGVGPLITAAPVILTALTFAGAAYLISLGIRTLVAAGSARVAAADDNSPRSRVRQILRGAGVSALNPKGLLLFLSILPQFAQPRAGWPLPLQLAALGLVFMASCAAIYVPLGIAARHVLGSRPRFARITSRVAGIAMVAVGTVLIVERTIELVR